VDGVSSVFAVPVVPLLQAVAEDDATQAIDCYATGVSVLESIQSAIDVVEAELFASLVSLQAGRLDLGLDPQVSPPPSASAGSRKSGKRKAAAAKAAPASKRKKSSASG
jgi:hypothetical protein